MTCDPRLIVQQPQRPLAVVRADRGAVVRHSPERIVIADPMERQDVVVDRPSPQVTVQRSLHHLVERVERGPQGPPGETEGATFVAAAGETVHGLRAVRLDNGIAFHPNVLDAGHAPAVCGIAVQSAPAGAPVVVRTAGSIVEPSWTWSPGFVWCGLDGVLTQTPHPTGWLLVVARAVSPTTLVVDIDSPVVRL